MEQALGESISITRSRARHAAREEKCRIRDDDEGLRRYSPSSTRYRRPTSNPGPSDRIEESAGLNNLLINRWIRSFPIARTRMQFAAPAIFRPPINASLSVRHRWNAQNAREKEKRVGMPSR